MVYCSSCGTQASDSDSVCGNCGATLLRVQSTQSVDDIVVEKASESVQQVNSRIPLAADEHILWHKEEKKGLLHKEVVVEEAVTNKRCLKYDVQTGQIVAQIGISHLPQVIVMNVRRINDSLGGGVFLTPRLLGIRGLGPLGGLGVYGGPRRGFLKIFGDVSMMNEGKVVLTFENVKDPQGLRQLIEALKRENAPWPRRNWLAAGPPTRLNSTK